MIKKRTLDETKAFPNRNPPVVGLACATRLNPKQGATEVEAVFGVVENPVDTVVDVVVIVDVGEIVLGVVADGVVVDDVVVETTIGETLRMLTVDSQEGISEPTDERPMQMLVSLK